jgi:glycosyltransferase involved in cell wall biosynthesis
VLSIAHTAVSRAAGRLRYYPCADDPTLEVQLLVPLRWHEFGRWLDADPPTDPGLEVHPLPIRMPRAGPASWYLHVYPALGRTVRRFAPGVIHLWEEPWSLVALHASFLARRQGAALVLEVDQNIIKGLPPPFGWIRGHVLRNTDLVLARSDDAVTVVRANGYQGPVLRIGYGVDQEVFRPVPGVGPAALPASRLRIGYVGRLVVEKGLDDLIDALAGCTADVELAILGQGPHEPALRAHAEAAGVADRVTFEPWTDPAGVAAFLRGLHALALVTRTTGAVKEQFGRVIIEAQACGTPVIGSSCGAIPDVIGRGGWIVPEADPSAMAALFDRLAAAPEEIAARATAGLANVGARFTNQIVANDLARGWRAAFAAHHSPRRSAARLQPAHRRSPAGLPPP